jgi:anaerobic selenocysteine-containing dehydrogenase
LTYGNLCWPAGLEAVRLTLGTVKHNVPWDLENAGVIVIWGKNPAATNIQEMTFISKARDKGAKIIVVDPLRTSTADKADWLFTPKPATDGILALAIARILINEDLIDKSFIDKNVKGFEEFNRSLTITLTEAEKVTGIPESGIRFLAQTIGSSESVTFLPGYGLQRHFNGGQTVRAILALAILTGNIGKRGAGFNYANLQSLVYDEPKEPLQYYPDPDRDKPFRRTISMARLGRDILDSRDPEIKFAWIERGNPVLQVPDSTSVIAALKKLEFSVIVEQFFTDTAKYADLILPAKNMFEQTDIVGSYWSPYLQLKPKILDPPGEVMPESEIYYHLGRILKLKTDHRIIPLPGEENIKQWLKNRISGYGKVSFEELEQGPVIPPDIQTIAYEDLKFDTPSGKIEMISDQAASQWNVSALPGFSCESNLNRGNYPLTLITPNAGSRIHSQFGNLEIIRKTVDSPSLEISPDDASVRKIKTGDLVRVANDYGEFTSHAIVSERVLTGCVVIPNGLWLSEGGGCNLLIKPSETDMGFGAAFHDTTVEVEKID